MRNPSKKVRQTKSNKKLKHVHFSAIIIFKLVIPADKRDRQSKNRLVKALFNSGVSESILAKAKADKLPVKKTKQERQWSTVTGVLTTNTKTATSFSFPELHANKRINQSLHVVGINIDRYDMIIGRDLIRSLGIDIHGDTMTIHWDNSTISWRNIDSTQTIHLRYCNKMHCSILKPRE